MIEDTDFAGELAWFRNKGWKRLRLMNFIIGVQRYKFFLFFVNDISECVDIALQELKGIKEVLYGRQSLEDLNKLFQSNQILQEEDQDTHFHEKNNGFSSFK